MFSATGRVGSALLTLMLFQQSTPTSLHVLKISAGPAGEEANGVFTLTSERSTFSRTTDREVIVFFQWEGLAGQHTLVANWRSPDGSLTSSSTVQYEARDRRFGAYWRLALTPTVPTGLWSIEATVDGQAGGRFTFEIRDEAVAAPIVKRPLAQPELYEILSRAFIVLERVSATGRQLESTGGMLSGGGRITTSMSTIDAVAGVRAVMPDGSRRDLDAVISWHRRQDWVVLSGGPDMGASPAVASSDGLKIGDRCFSIEGSAEGGRVLVDCGLTGYGDTAGGRRFLATFGSGTGTPGAPVINEFGEVIGIVGASGVPGTSRLIELLSFRADLKGVPVIPLSAVRFRPDQAPERLGALRSRGEILLPLDGDAHVVSGGFAKAMQKDRTVVPADQRGAFSTSDKSIVVFVTWFPQERLRGTTQLRLFNTDNKVVAESKPGKSDLRKDRSVIAWWELPVPSTPGMYRADVLLNDKPAWRQFVRITP